MRELSIPPFVYLPLCSSQDVFQCIRRALPDDCHAFTTKARVPCLMLFELERHPTNCDTASFLGMQLEQYKESVVVDTEVRLQKSSFATAAELNEEVAANDVDEQVVSCFMPYYLGNKESVWTRSGTGIRRATVCSTLLASRGSSRPPSSNISVSSVEQAKHSSPSSSISVPIAASDTAGVDNALSLDMIAAANKVQRDPTDAAATSSKSVLASSACIGETFFDKIERIRTTSKMSILPGWTIGGLIAKSNDDVRQEVSKREISQSSTVNLVLSNGHVT
jgi:hypothetical protein